MLSTQAGNLPTIMAFLYACSSAAVPVLVFISLPFKKKNCMVLLALEFAGFETNPSVFIPPVS